MCLYFSTGYLWSTLTELASADRFLINNRGLINLEVLNSRLMGRISLNGNSSSPVEPIKPLLNLGSKGLPDEVGLSLPPNPVFHQGTPTNISALEDNSAYLHCIVHSLGNKSVSSKYFFEQI